MRERESTVKVLITQEKQTNKQTEQTNKNKQTKTSRVPRTWERFYRALDLRLFRTYRTVQRLF